MANSTMNYQPVKEFEVVDIEEPFLPNLQHRRGQQQRQTFSSWVIVLMTVFLTTTIICALQAIFPMLRPNTMCMGVVEQKGFPTEWGMVRCAVE
jgi:hypothetical protein